MSNPTPNYIPEDPDATDHEALVTREVDGETVLDPDADPDLIDSAEADRLASGVAQDADVEDEPGVGTRRPDGD